MISAGNLSTRDGYAVPISAASSYPLPGSQVKVRVVWAVVGHLFSRFPIIPYLSRY